MPNLRNQSQYINEFNIDKEAEKLSWQIRFKDLKPRARARFITALKSNSSVRSLRAVKETALLQVTEDLNPILLNVGWNGGFSSSSFFRWKEQILSSAIFNSIFRRNPRPMNMYNKRALFDTPRSTYIAAHPTFVCSRCGETLDSNRMDYWVMNRCTSCTSVINREAYADRELARSKSTS